MCACKTAAAIIETTLNNCQLRVVGAAVFLWNVLYLIILLQDYMKCTLNYLTEDTMLVYSHFLVSLWPVLPMVWSKLEWGDMKWMVLQLPTEFASWKTLWYLDCGTARGHSSAKLQLQGKGCPSSRFFKKMCSGFCPGHWRNRIELQNHGYIFLPKPIYTSNHLLVKSENYLSY